MRLVLHFLVTALLIWAVATYGTGIGVSLAGPNTFISALIFAVILAIINMLLGSLLRTLGMPLNIVTLGLFSFIVTLIVIWVTDRLYDGISINGIVAYLVIAFVPMVTSAIVGSLKS